MTDRWVIHLPITAPDLHRARIFARTAARVLARLSARVEPGGVTVSAEDQQNVRHWVFCDRLLPGGSRCALPVDHTSPCSRCAPWLNRR
ncbi:MULTISPECIES: hypothetical protein [Micromonospora]|uniref:Uncharacterized protein n=1 Tax=Micromonospora sicca TaxID=2202420 RepID=A0A317DJP8_9ACTN|nr:MULTISPECIES: hypothetical protein [unclassified Micromonospora]MBM0225244.1 hypothetical protein [Micromonospora sp. ATA51]PWR14460.1 hypothetical protein DKT69_16215 [Micromonospora sp. 4G51]